MKKKIKYLTFEEIISIHNSSICNECPLKDNNGYCIRTGVNYNFNTEFLEKEIEIKIASSTLSECIKEWENKGFIVENDELYIFLNHKHHHLSIVIVKNEIKYHIYYGYISLELNELLNKTLKALEVKNE